MSIQAYVNKVKQGIDAKIKENLDYATAHPYPVDELNELIESLGPDSNISKIYGPNGELASLETFSNEDITAAIKEAESVRGLWKKLQAGQKGLTGKSFADQTLSQINPENDLKSAYLIFSTAIDDYISKGSRITFDELFNTETDNFIRYLKFGLDLPITLNTFGADDLVKEAFIELYNKSIEQLETPINSTSTKNEEATAPAPQINPEQPGTSQKTQQSAANAINPENKKSSEATVTSSSKESVTASPGELTKESTKPAESKVSPININLESTKQAVKPETTVKPNQTTLTSKSATINNTINKPTTIPTSKVEAISNISNNSINSSVSKSELNALPTTEKIQNVKEKINNTIGSSTIEKLTNTSEKLNSNTVNLKDTVSKDNVSKLATSSVVNNLQKNDSITKSLDSIKSLSTTQTASSVTKESNNNITVDRKSMEVSKPKETKEITQNNSSQSSNSVSNSNTSSSPSTSTNSTNSVTQSSESSTNNSNVNNQSATPSQGTQQVNNTSSIDISQLVNSINRLERLLLSGIDVTIKDNY